MDRTTTPGAVEGTTSYRSASDWEVGAACQEVDPELFFPETPSDMREAKSICSGCAVQPECLSAALERGEPHGVWGGELFNAGRVVQPKFYSREVNLEAVNAERRIRADEARDELIVQVEDLVRIGADAERAAGATGRSVEALKRYLYRAKRHDLVASLTGRAA